MSDVTLAIVALVVGFVNLWFAAEAALAHAWLPALVYLTVAGALHSGTLWLLRKRT